MQSPAALLSFSHALDTMSQKYPSVVMFHPSDELAIACRKLRAAYLACLHSRAASSPDCILALLVGYLAELVGARGAEFDFD